MRRWSFFRQILIGMMVAVAAAVSAGAYLASGDINSQLARSLAEETRGHAATMAEALGTQNLQEQVRRLAPLAGRRTTVIDLNGRVLADSEVAVNQLGDVENHSARPEVRDALALGWGWSIRHSSTVGSDYLYVAITDHPRKRVIRLAVPFREYQQLEKNIRAAMLGGITLGTLAALIIAFAIAKRLSRELVSLVKVTQDRVAGKRAAFTQSGNHDFAVLTHSLDDMTSQIDSRVDELEHERARLRVILDNMIEGVILCDGQGKIILWNAAFCRMFEYTENPAGRKLIEVSRAPEVIRLASQVLAKKEPIALEFPLGAIMLQTTFVPLARAEGFLAVFHDITLQVRTDRVRRDFVANVSHELRTPLAAISGYAESLLEGGLEDSSIARSFVEGIGRNASRLTSLIEDLLDLGRIESGRYSFNPENLNVRALVTAAAETATRLDTKRHHFTNEVAPEIEAWADRKGLGQILVNLLDNAAKYSPPETKITVRSWASRGEVSIAVIDSGPGIPPEDLPRIFERFYRGDKSRNAAGEPGTGLGLAICKHLATEMGGSITAASTGSGTTITLSLPLASLQR